jgi:hypothetical protein
MIQAGSNVLQQKNQVLHKVVDERWLSTIEESLDAINNIIDKPRRFVTTKEEVVPVALAKKITADSVRHLSMNTQFIASDEDNNIQPTRILNVSTEESYDLYENRFIYHLIQRLVTFIDKRTDIIFWSTGDEKKNILSYQSKVEDAYEEIEYKLEMSIKNRQSFAENDSDNMQVFMRIDRVRRMVMSLRNSSFCSLMAGCSKVRSPIQRTNLMMKDPNYRTCYKLWQFLESYDEVGYTIDVQDSTLEFDEEYLFQLYTNLITNYTVFKSLLEDRPRDLDEPLAKRHRTIKPKFIKKIEEQVVDDYDIPDVEIRQVIIEEVTQAQLDAEAKLAEETAARAEAEEALESMESQMMGLQQQLFSAMEMSTEAAEQVDILEQEKAEALMAQETLRQEKEEALEALKQEQEQALSAMRAAQEEEIKQLKAAQEEALAQLRERQSSELARVQEQMNKEKQQIQEDAASQLQQAKKESDEQLQKVKQESDEQLQKVKQESDEQLQKVRQESVEQVQKVRNESDAQIQKVKKETDAQLQQMKQKSEQQLQQVQKDADQQLKLQQRLAAEKLAKTQEEAEQKLQAEQEAAAKAQAYAADQLAWMQNQSKNELKKVKEDAAKELADTKAAAEKELAESQAASEKEVAETRAAAEKQVNDTRIEAQRQIGETRISAEKQVNEIRSTSEKQVQETKEQAQKQIQMNQDETAKQLQNMQSEHEKQLEKLQQELTQARAEAAAQQKRADKEAKARAKAQERADANRLSKYLIDALNNRKQKNADQEDSAGKDQ